MLQHRIPAAIVMFSLAWGGSAGLATPPSKKPAAPNIKMPPRFPPVQATVVGYSEEPVIAGTVHLFFTCKSEDASTGSKQIFDLVNNQLATLGLAKNEASYFATPLNDNYLEYHAKSAEALGRLVNRMAFYNSRNLGTFSGKINQVFATLKRTQCHWENGVTVVGYDFNLEPLGNFEYAGKVSLRPMFRNDLVLDAVYGALGEGRAAEGSPLITYHSERALQEFLADGLIPARHEVNPELANATALSPKLLVGAWAGINSSMALCILRAEEGPDGKTSVTLSITNADGVKVTRVLDDTGNPGQLAFRDGKLLNEDRTLVKFWNYGMTAPGGENLTPDHKLFLSLADDVIFDTLSNGPNVFSIFASPNCKYYRMKDKQAEKAFDYAGKWKGVINKHGTTKIEVTLELINTSDGFTGTSTIEETKRTGVFTLKGRRYDQGTMVMETSLVENPQKTGWAFKTFLLGPIVGEDHILGLWSGQNAKGQPYGGGGSLELRRVSK